MSRLSALILAAGASRRFGQTDKLAAEYQGKPLLFWVMDSLKAFDFHEIIVVIRPDQILPDMGVSIPYQCVIIDKADHGMGQSIATGIGALKPCDGAFIVLGDMPLVPPSIYGQLAQHMERGDIIRPRFQHRPGHPVLFAAKTFDDLRRLSGDDGAKDVINHGGFKPYFVESPDRGLYFDIDRPEDINRL